MNPNRNPVGWFEIYVQDMERARAFYENTFQFKMETLEAPPGMPITMTAFPAQGDSGEDECIHQKPGAPGVLAKMEGKDSGVGGTLVYFSVEDCAVEAARAGRHGGKVHLPKTPIEPYGFIALVLDTEGNMFGLHSVK